MSEDVKYVLYAAIDKIGKEKIRTSISTNVEASEKYCSEIIAECSTKLGTDNDVLTSLCEALLHFMLTAALIPSERKVSVESLEFDIVIPSVRILRKRADRSLVIQIIKSEKDVKIDYAVSVQQNNENIWLVSVKPIQTGFRNYHLSSGDFPYSRIISDVTAFLKEKGDTGMKLLHS